MSEGRAIAPRAHIAVVVPAHDEAACIADCLASIERAAHVAVVRGYVVSVYVVCDACSDETPSIARSRGHHVLAIEARNVGLARAYGAKAAIDDAADWLAFTDADSVVAPDWLLAQVGLDSDAVCGTISVDDWSEHHRVVRDRFESAYQDRDGHRHIHGANLGIATHAYRRAGGFDAVECDEDVGIVAALERVGARISWSAAPRVVTSSRKAFRAPRGFGAHLAGLASS